MSNKNKILIRSIMGLLFSATAIVFSGRAEAGTVIFSHFDPADPIRTSYSMIHFAFPLGSPSANDNQGGIFWLPSIDLAANGGATLHYWTTAPSGRQTRICQKQVRGLYHATSRGNKLFPLDAISLAALQKVNSNYADLRVSGGLYTTCTGGSEPMPGTSIYGQITYTDRSLSPAGIVSTLSAGLAYNISNTVDSYRPGWYPSLSYFNNATPIGYIYDGLEGAGVGFVGGAFSGHEALLDGLDEGINSLFTGTIKDGNLCSRKSNHCVAFNEDAGLDTAWYLAILGNTLLSRGGVDGPSRQSIIGNINKNSAIIFSDILNTADIINSLRKNATMLCRGKQWINRQNPNSDGSNVLCFDNGPGEDREVYNNAADPVVIDLESSEDYNGKEIIVKGRNVVLEGAMPTDAALNLFVDRGNVILRPPVVQYTAATSPKFIKFNAEGGIVESPTGLATEYNHAHFLRGNIFVNGIIVGGTGGANDIEAANLTGIVNKYYMYGRLGTLNTALHPSLGRQNMMSEIFGSIDAPVLAPYVSLQNVFTWQCGIGLTAIGTDGSPCQVDNDKFKYNSFVLVKGSVPTRLLP